MTKHKILIVEDEKDTRFILERLLTKNGYEIKSCLNGAEALKIISDFNPHLVLADWTMPVMDGIELCNMVKQDEKFHLIYFIILTARASLQDRVTGLDIGADDFLVKPVENQELLARIRTGLRIQDLQNELKNSEHNKALVEVACTIGHQINNPLSSLSMAIQHLSDELHKEKNESVKEDLHIIYESFERIKKLANDLTHIENPTVINYISDKRMIKMD